VNGLAFNAIKYKPAAGELILACTLRRRAPNTKKPNGKAEHHTAGRRLPRVYKTANRFALYDLPNAILKRDRMKVETQIRVPTPEAN